MNEKQALSDLKAIRQIMDRTRQSASGESGWFSVIGGMMWLVGFLSNQIMADHLASWVRLAGSGIGLLLIAWLWIRLTRQGHMSSPVMRSIMLSWLALWVFGALFFWLFGLDTIHQILLLVLVLTALGCMQMGLLFTYWPLCAIGTALITVTVGTYFLIPDHFIIIASVLGSGLLIGNGLWQVRSGRQAQEKNYGSQPSTR